MKSSLRTVLALLVTSVPWLAMVAQSQRQEMNPSSEPRMESAEPEKHAVYSAGDMKMQPENHGSKMKKEKMEKNKAKKMKKKDDKQEENSSGFSIYG